MLSAELACCQSLPMYLMYVRGDGPEIAPGMAFKLEKSSGGVAFLEPEWPGAFLTYGSLAGGIDVVVRCGEDWCSGAETVSYMGTIPVVNFSETGTFTVKVSESPNYNAVVVLLCQPAYPMYHAIGGTFVFNGECRAPTIPTARSSPSRRRAGEASRACSSRLAHLREQTRSRPGSVRGGAPNHRSRTILRERISFPACRRQKYDADATGFPRLSRPFHASE